MILIFIYDLGYVCDFCDLVVLINKIVFVYGEILEVFIFENFVMIFGGVLFDLLMGNSFLEEMF